MRYRLIIRRVATIAAATLAVLLSGDAGAQTLVQSKRATDAFTAAARSQAPPERVCEVVQRVWCRFCQYSRHRRLHQNWRLSECRQYDQPRSLSGADGTAMREVVILTLLCGTILIMAAAIAVHFVLQ